MNTRSSGAVGCCVWVRILAGNAINAVSRNPTNYIPKTSDSRNSIFVFAFAISPIPDSQFQISRLRLRNTDNRFSVANFHHATFNKPHSNLGNLSFITLGGGKLRFVAKQAGAPVMKRFLLFAIVLIWVALACGLSVPATAFPKPETSVFDAGRTVYGFFPSPPELTNESMLATIQGIGEHGEVILVQEALPWAEFLDEVDGDSQSIQHQRNLTALAGQKKLEVIFVIDPLNGLDRRQFAPLPSELAGGNFGTTSVRSAFMNYALRLTREFHPRYLGLASEINTYADAHPDDFLNFVSLYREIYAAVKAESPDTQVFVTFQWDDLNNAIPFDSTGGEPYQTKWEQIEIFEPYLDVWAITSYPFVAFGSAADIPPAYYTPLLSRTDKPLAVAEGGVNSRAIGQFKGTPKDQVDYLNAIHTQLGNRLTFWIYLILNDINGEAYRDFLAKNGMETTADTILWFVAVGLRELDGTPKPALGIWDSFRTTKTGNPE